MNALFSCLPPYHGHLGPVPQRHVCYIKELNRQIYRVIYRYSTHPPSGCLWNSTSIHALCFLPQIHLNGRKKKKKKSGPIRAKIKLSPTNYTQVISGYFVNIKDPLVPVFCASFAFWWNWSGCVWTRRLSVELQRWADESDSFATTWLKRMSHRPLSNHFLHNN